MSSYIAVGVSMVTGVIAIGCGVVTWTVAVTLGVVGLILGIGMVLASGDIYTPLDTTHRGGKTSGGSTVHSLLCDMRVSKVLVGNVRFTMSSQ